MTRGCWCVCFPRDPRNKGNLETTGSSSIRDAGYPDSGLAALVPARHINHRNGLAACKRNTGGKQVARNDPPLSHSCAQEPGEKGVRRSPSGQVPVCAIQQTRFRVRPKTVRTFGSPCDIRPYETVALIPGLKRKYGSLRWYVANAMTHQRPIKQIVWRKNKTYETSILSVE